MTAQVVGWEAQAACVVTRVRNARRRYAGIQKVVRAAERAALFCRENVRMLRREYGR